jgi:SAM-dependent methyltransferase
MSDSQSKLNPLIYRALHTGTFGDQQFYRALTKAKLASNKDLKVLELGCGSGRILLDLVQLGADVTGIDISAEALDFCRLGLASISIENPALSNNVKLIHADFTEVNQQLFTPEFPKFDLIFITYNGLYCLPSEEAQVDLLKRCIKLLGSEGELWLDGYALPDPQLYEYDSASDFTPLTVIELPSTSFRPHRTLGVEELDTFDQPNQKLTVQYRYKAPVEELEREPLHNQVEILDHRYIYPWELPELSQQAGGSLVNVRTYFGGDPITLDQNLRDLDWGIEFEHWIATLKRGDEVLV